jgi:hypothetical protein
VSPLVETPRDFSQSVVILRGRPIFGASRKRSLSALSLVYAYGANRGIAAILARTARVPREPKAGGGQATMGVARDFHPAEAGGGGDREVRSRCPGP